MATQIVPHSDSTIKPQPISVVDAILGQPVVMLLPDEALEVIRILRLQRLYEDALLQTQLTRAQRHAVALMRKERLRLREVLGLPSALLEVDPPASAIG
jgi:hypothetical protein